MKQEQKYYIIRKDRRNEEYADAPYLLGMQQRDTMEFDAGGHLRPIVTYLWGSRKRDAKIYNSLMEANSTACEIGGCDVECIGGSV